MSVTCHAHGGGKEEIARAACCQVEMQGVVLLLPVPSLSDEHAPLMDVRCQTCCRQMAPVAGLAGPRLESPSISASRAESLWTSY
ncbi:hypothetical protein C0Q70_08722 [Pomacea canaliculata]|uniref:Uncharacterized protein n=1 Tax=Pomacea canaliculata TaxID=400727 RepID=A0A2T7P7T1_POMCA|nr:hypothetical protein C0Q70_08722 [Pomacea canaliculata]